jgi:Holliday junction resolvase RusA-like endonuclease
MELKLIFPGEVRVKKNSMTVSYVYRNKLGHLKIRMDQNGRFTPVTYYSKAYTEWAREAIQSAIIFKSKHPEIQFPLDGQYNLKCLFYSAENKRVDLSNLMEGVQDCLTGNAGVFKDSIPGNLYQTLLDDSVRFIGSIDGSRYVYSPTDIPRTEIILTEFKW